MPRKRKGLLFIILLVLLSSSGWQIKDIFGGDQNAGLSDSRRQHILYGDQRGGGHMHGVGKPCKSEFPQSWDENKIIDTVTLIAANDNLDWKQQDNGYHVAETNRDGVVVRVVLNPDKDDVITAYPINVQRNPCPAKPSNDNYND